MQALPTLLKTLDCKNAQQTEERNAIYALQWDVCPDDTWPNEAQVSEKEEQLQKVSDWSEDIENAHEFKARLPTLRRRPWQPPNVIIPVPSRRRRPAGWPKGV